LWTGARKASSNIPTFPHPLGAATIEQPCSNPLVEVHSQSHIDLKVHSLL